METKDEIQKLLDENKKLKQELRDATKLSSLPSIVINTLKRTIAEAVNREKKMKRLEKENQNLQKQLEKTEEENNINKAIMFATHDLNDTKDEPARADNVSPQHNIEMPQNSDDIIKLYFGPIDIKNVAREVQQKNQDRNSVAEETIVPSYSMDNPDSQNIVHEEDSMDTLNGHRQSRDDSKTTVNKLQSNSREESRKHTSPSNLSSEKIKSHSTKNNNVSHETSLSASVRQNASPFQGKSKKNVKNSEDSNTQNSKKNTQKRPPDASVETKGAIDSSLKTNKVISDNKKNIKNNPQNKNKVSDIEPGDIQNIYMEGEVEESEVPDICSNIESIFSDASDFNDDDII